MSGLLIPDSGPLFSLAAGGLLEVLLNFEVAITDMVKAETIDGGLASGASPEASALLAFYNSHAARLQVVQTQVGADVKAAKRRNPSYCLPRNLGELSIQSLLIGLQISEPGSGPHVILFEDGWFMRNASALSKPCLLLSTQAFLLDLERRGFIASADAARAAIATFRPTSNADPLSVSIR